MEESINQLIRLISFAPHHFLIVFSNWINNPYSVEMILLMIFYGFLTFIDFAIVFGATVYLLGIACLFIGGIFSPFQNTGKKETKKPVK